MTTPPPAPPPPEALAASAASAPPPLPPLPPPPPYHIRPVPASATYALRHAVLWPDRPPAYVQLAEDADGWHFGAFLGAPPAAGATPEHQQEEEEKEEPISVLSLFLDDSLLHPPADADNTPRTTTYYRFRKFATAAAWQGRGAGSALLRHVMALAAARQPEQPPHDDGDGNRGGGESEGGRKNKSPGASDGGVVIWCDARQSALPFYARFGFAAAGDVFYKGDVPYLQMSRRLV